MMWKPNVSIEVWIRMFPGLGEDLACCKCENRPTLCYPFVSKEHVGLVYECRLCDSQGVIAIFKRSNIRSHRGISNFLIRNEE